MAYRGATAPCVACGKPMWPDSTDAGAAMEICGDCGGVWMEVASFLTELRKAQPELKIDELMEHNDGTPRRPCPRCDEPMAIAWLVHLQLDQCAQHGVWFDRGELERALAGEHTPPDLAETLRVAAELSLAKLKKK